MPTPAWHFLCGRGEKQFSSTARPQNISSRASVAFLIKPQEQNTHTLPCAPNGIKTKNCPYVLNHHTVLYLQVVAVLNLSHMLWIQASPNHKLRVRYNWLFEVKSVLCYFWAATGCTHKEEMYQSCTRLLTLNTCWVQSRRCPFNKGIAGSVVWALKLNSLAFTKGNWTPSQERAPA